MDDKKDYQSFQVRQTTVISGKIVAKDEDMAESDFHKDILDILRTHGYSAKIVSNLKIPNRTKLDLHPK